MKNLLVLFFSFWVIGSSLVASADDVVTDIPTEETEKVDTLLVSDLQEMLLGQTDFVAQADVNGDGRFSIADICAFADSIHDRTINFSACLENDAARRFLEEVQYNPEDYEYSLVTNYAPVGKALDNPNPLVIRLDGNRFYGKEWITLYRDKALQDVVKTEQMTCDSFVIWNTIPGDTLYYRVLDDEEHLVQQGYVTGTGQLRMIHAPSVGNVRDLGGWKVPGGRIRYGKLFRGAKFHSPGVVNITSEDSLRFRELGIKCEIDLRGTTESDKNETRRYSELGKDVAYVNYVPGSAAYLTAVEGNVSLFWYSWRQYKSYLLNGVPSYIHCAVGCDRTGTLALVLEGFLGVSENDLNLDYELSSFCASNSFERHRNEHLTHPEYDFRNTMKYIKSLPGDNLQQQFEHFLRVKVGISQNDLDTLKNNLIEKIEDETEEIEEIEDTVETIDVES